MSEVTVTVTAVEAGRVELVASKRALPGATEVAGPTLVSVLSPGTELSLSYPVEPRYPLPLALGYAAVFRVGAIGADVEGITVGDVVMSMGPHASWQCLPAAHVIPVPDGLAPEVAVFSRIMNVPMAAVATSNARPGQTAGVIGLGIIGQLTARVLAAAGFETIAADDSEERRRLVARGIATCVTLADASVDLLIECSGREENVLAGARALRASGELVLTGVPWRRRADTPLFDVADLVFHRLLTMRSGWEWQVPLTALGIGGGMDMIRLFARSMQMLRDGVVVVDGLSGVISPGEVPAAYEALRARSAGTLTQVVRWWQ